MNNNPIKLGTRLQTYTVYMMRAHFTTSNKLIRLKGAKNVNLNTKINDINDTYTVLCTPETLKLFFTYSLLKHLCINEKILHFANFLKRQNTFGRNYVSTIGIAAKFCRVSIS